MRIIENRTGKEITYKFDSGYDTKVFKQRVNITKANTTIKLVSMFCKSTSDEKFEYLKMEERAQYVKVNWSDGSPIYKTRGTELIDDGKYNVGTGLIIKHTFKQPGIYTVEIESVSDLVMIDEDYDLSSFDITYNLRPYGGIRLETIGIGGIINNYLDPGLDVYNSFTSNIKDYILRNIEVNEFNTLVNDLRTEVEFRAPVSWNLTVNKFKGMVEPLSLRFPSQNNFSFFFSNWQIDSEGIDDDTITVDLDDTLFNLLRHRNFNLVLSGMFSCSKGLVKGIEYGNIGKVLHKYAFDVKDYWFEYTADIVHSYNYIMWNIQTFSDDIVFRIFEDEMKYWGSTYLISSGNGEHLFEGSFGLIQGKHHSPFRFSMFTTKVDTKTALSNMDGTIPNGRFDISFMCFGSNIKIVPVYAINEIKFFKNLNNLEMSMDFAFCTIKSEEVFYGGDIRELPKFKINRTMGYVPIISPYDVMKSGIDSVSISMTYCFGNGGAALCRNLKQLYKINARNENKIKVELLSSREVINNNRTDKITPGSYMLDLSYLMANGGYGEDNKNVLKVDIDSTYSEYMSLLSNREGSEIIIDNKRELRVYEIFDNMFTNTVPKGDFGNPYSVIELDTNKFKLYSPAFFSNFSKSIDITQSYAGTFDGVALDYKGGYNILQEIGANFIVPDEKKSVYKYSNHDVTNYRHFINLDSICHNASIKTKQYVLNTLTRNMNKNLVKVNNENAKDLIYNLDYKTPVIRTAESAFENSDEVLRDFEWSNEDVYKLNHNPLDMLLIPSELFFKGNYDIRDSYFLPLNRMFRNVISIFFLDKLDVSIESLGLDVTKFDISEIFAISNITAESDKEAGYRYSGFKNDYNLKYNKIHKAKNSFIFDNFKLFNIRNIDLNEYNFYEKLDNHSEIRNSLVGRKFLMEPIKHICMYDNRFITDMNYNINGIDFNDENIVNRFHNTFDKNSSYNFNIMLTGNNLSDLSDGSSNTERINYTPGYSLHILNAYDNCSKDVNLMIRPRTCMWSLMSEVDENNMINNIDVSGLNSTINTIDYYISGFDNAVHKDLVLNDVNNEELARQFSSEQKVTTLKGCNTFKEVRTIIDVSSKDKYILFPEATTKSVDGTEYDSSLISYPSCGDSEFIKSHFKFITNNPSIIRGSKYYYVSPLTGFVLDLFLRNKNGGNFSINQGSVNRSGCKFIWFRDMFDILYYNEYMVRDNITTTLYSNNLYGISNVKILKSYDLKCISYFNVVTKMSIGKENLKYIDCPYGLIHNNYTIYNTPLTRNTELYDFGGRGEGAEHPNLKFIMGRLVNPIECDTTLITDLDKFYNMKGYTIKNFLVQNNEGDTLEYVSPEFFEGISYINRNVNETRSVILYDVFTSLYVKNADFLSKTLSANVYFKLSNICTRTTNKNILNTFDDYQFEDIEVYVCNHRPVITHKDYVGLSRGPMLISNVLYKPNNLVGDYCTKLEIVPVRNVREVIHEDCELGGLKNLFIDSSEAFGVNDFMFLQVRNERRSVDPDISGTRRFFTLLYEGITSFQVLLLEHSSNGLVAVKGTINSNITGNFEYEHHYMNKVLFNEFSTKKLEMKDIREIWFNNNKIYRMVISGITVNKSCNITVIYLNGESKTIKYTSGEVLNFNVFTNTCVSNGIFSIEFTDIDNSSEDLLAVNIKYAIDKTITRVMNEEMFQPRIFVKDNNDKLFEMQRLYFRKKPGIEGNWNINIHKSNLTRVDNSTVSVGYGKIIDSSDYRGLIMFSDNTVNIKHKFDMGHLNNNSLSFNIDASKDTFVLYCINDTPFITENSDAVIERIEGPFVFDLAKYISLDSSNSIDVGEFMRTFCNNSSIPHVDYNLFKNFNKNKTINGEFIFKMSGFNIINFDFNILKGFSNSDIVGISDILRNGSEFYLTGRIPFRKKSFSISNCFNGVLNLSGYDVYSPFKNSCITEISNSFNNTDVNNFNSILPNGLLDFKTNSKLVIRSSFQNCLILHPLRTYSINSNNTNIEIYGLTFNKSVIKEYMDIYKDYIYNFILNYRGKISEPEFTFDYLIRNGSEIDLNMGYDAVMFELKEKQHQRTLDVVCGTLEDVNNIFNNIENRFNEDYRTNDTILDNISGLKVQRKLSYNK